MELPAHRDVVAYADPCRNLLGFRPDPGALLRCRGHSSTRNLLFQLGDEVDPRSIRVLIFSPFLHLLVARLASETAPGLRLVLGPVLVKRLIAWPATARAQCRFPIGPFKSRLDVLGKPGRFTGPDYSAKENRSRDAPFTGVVSNTSLMWTIKGATRDFGLSNAPTFASRHAAHSLSN